MERPDGFQSELAPGEPAPPAGGQLFAGHEVAAFESFLDNLATENEFLFHPKVPASLSWNGFHSTKNQGFDEFKHSGLQFGSDTHFSTTNGYVATHKYVPVGYGHVHPQSSAQRSQRSSQSSRTPSRRASIYNEPAQAGLSPYPHLSNGSPATTHQENGMYGNMSTLPAMQTERPGQQDFRSSASTYNHASPHQLRYEELRPGSHRTQPTPASPEQFRMPDRRVLSALETRDDDRDHHPVAFARHVDSPDQFGNRHDSSEPDSISSKRIKLEDGISKQPLTAGESSRVFFPAYAHLTLAQKRQNHISSEQRRRNLIKEGFNELSAIVPSVVGNASKSTILHEAIEFIRKNEMRNRELRSRIKELRARQAGVS